MCVLNPIFLSFSFNFSTQGGLQLFVRAMHIYSGSNRALIDHFRLQESISPGADISFRNYTGIKHNANIVARFSLTCTKGYYQPNCSTYCAPQNSDNMGHYMCDESTGEKICLHGYTNPARNCTVCVPASGCCECLTIYVCSLLNLIRSSV